MKKIKNTHMASSVTRVAVRRPGERKKSQTIVAQAGARPNTIVRHKTLGKWKKAWYDAIRHMTPEMVAAMLRI